MRTADEFMERVRVQPNGCWKWTFPLARGRYATYGRCTLNGEQMGAHRAAWLLFRGPIPDGLHIDHLCRNTRCVNPDHLEPVTPQENWRRGLNGALRTHCRYGHPLDGENTGPNGAGKRRCRTCANEQARARRKSA